MPYGRDDNETYLTDSEIYALEDAEYLYSGPIEDELNDLGHPKDCGCRYCFPEAHDEGELEAGRSDRIGVAS